MICDGLLAAGAAEGVWTGGGGGGGLTKHRTNVFSTNMHKQSGAVSTDVLATETTPRATPLLLPPSAALRGRPSEEYLPTPVNINAAAAWEGR